MLSDPVKFFDSLVRGVVLALYDFVMLSVASLAFPFVRKTVRFWPSVLAITKRLSALTLLLIWLSIFFSLSLTTDLGSLWAESCPITMRDQNPSRSYFRRS
jgi:hypothetical protein